jgi:hypothetical protein
MPDALRPTNPDSQPTDAIAFELLTALRDQTSCPVCFLVSRMLNQYFDWLAYESVNDLDVRARLRRSLGYCAPHGRLWREQGDVLATAIIYNDVLTEVRRVLREYGPALANGDGGSLSSRLRGMFGAGQAGGGAAALAEALAPAGPCPACEETLQLEKRTIEAYAKGLAKPEFVEADRVHAMGLCLPHLRAVLPLAGGAGGALVEAYTARLDDTSAQLAEVIRKGDYRYAREPKGPEFGAPPRSVEQTAGLLPTRTNMPR